MGDSNAVRKYYADRTNGGHRYATEEFYAKEAREKLYHLGPGETLLDFGCGTADLLAYYAREFKALVGADFSDNMLTHAATRLATFDAYNVELICADDVLVWPKLGDRRFDVITAAGVVQYFTDEQLAAFLRHCCLHLNSGGRIAVFDLVDPRFYWLVKYGLFTEHPLGMSDVPRILGRAAKILARKVVSVFTGRPPDYFLGQTHHPALVRQYADRNGLTCQIVRSMYYEYRYHALLGRKV